MEKSIEVGYEMIVGELIQDAEDNTEVARKYIYKSGFLDGMTYVINRLGGNADE